MEKVFKSYILDSGRDICIGNKSLISTIVDAPERIKLS